jgi:AcrR family transcriptional regulator
MPRPKKTPEQLAEMRQQILEAAYAILLEKGPRGLTSRAIAERLGLAHMALFTYYPNQAAILKALSEREVVKMRPQQDLLEQRAAHEEITQVVQDALLFFMRYARENPNPYRLAWVLPEIAEESLEHSRQRMRGTVGYLARLLKIGMEQGKFAGREPVLAAATVLGMVNLPYILFYSGKMVDPEMRDRMADEMLAAALGYLKNRT